MALPRVRDPLTVITGLCGLLPVGALLAWTLGLGSFRTWFLIVGVPALLALVFIGFRVAPRRDRLQYALSGGIVGGLAGTLAYDLVRVPVDISGVRVFSPIESYGVLLTGASTSSTFTDLAGWSFHFVNGIGFGIAYAMVALGRNKWWAVGWAMVLETVTIVTPFAATYGLAGKYHLIAIAYAAHVAYGLPLGMVVRYAADNPPSLRVAGGMVGALVVSLVVLNSPFELPGGPEVTIRNGRMTPEWLRVEVGGCATFYNDALTSTIAVADGDPVLKPEETRRLCFSDPGVHRVRLNDEPYSGGFVIVDPN